MLEYLIQNRRQSMEGLRRAALENFEVNYENIEGSFDQLVDLRDKYDLGRWRISWREKYRCRDSREASEDARDDHINGGGGAMREPSIVEVESIVEKIVGSSKLRYCGQLRQDHDGNHLESAQDHLDDQGSRSQHRQDHRDEREMVEVP